MAGPTFPTIPVPTADPNALLQSVIALKQVVEMLTGQSGDGSRLAPHTFVQHDQPTAWNPGDLWLCEGPVFSLSVWNGDKWVLIADAPPTTMASQNIDANLSSRFLRRRMPNP